MTQSTWDKIYTQYEKTGTKWASLNNPIHGSFFSFIRRSTFAKKSVLDLGCGNGKYLKFLKGIGFQVVGTDSSPTAIAMSRKTLGKKADLRIANIYTKPIPSKKYDLIISIATMQHARKTTIKKLTNQIYRSLPINGKIFITLPQMSSLRRWATFEKTKKIAPGTYIPLLGPEKGLAHSFYEKNELKKLFARFTHLKIARDDMGRWIITGQKS